MAFTGCDNIKDIFCHWTDPKAYHPSLFPSYTYKNATLYVPKVCKGDYEEVLPWYNFSNIVETEYSGIDGISDYGLEIRVVDGTIILDGDSSIEVYSMLGQCVYRGNGNCIANLSPGIYIVKVGDKSVKVKI